MAKKTIPRLSSGEMNIVRMLWERQPVSLSEAHQAMQERGEQVGYTTIQTRLERLVQKGIVAKTGKRPARYRARVSPSMTNIPSSP